MADNIAASIPGQKTNSFIDIPVPEIISNAYVVLDDAKFNGDEKEDFNKLFLTQATIVNSARFKIRTKITQLRLMAIEKEKNFLNAVGAEMPKGDSFSTIFTDYFKLNERFRTISDDTGEKFSTIISTEDFTEMANDGLKEVFNKYKAGLFSDGVRKFLKEADLVFANTIRESIQKKDSVFSSFNPNDEEMVQKIHLVFGEKKLKELYNKAREENRKRAPRLTQRKIDPKKTQGYANEWAEGHSKDIITKSLQNKNYKNITVTIDNAGTTPTFHDRIIIGQTTYLKAKTNKKGKVTDYVITEDDLTEKVSVSQKGDNIIEVSFEDNEKKQHNYKIVISNKFRSFGDETRSIEIQSRGVINNQLKQISSLTDSPKLFESLLFLINNTTLGAIYQGRTKEINKLLETLSIVFMFDDLDQISKEDITNNQTIYLFQLNKQMACLSDILNQILRDNFSAISAYIAKSKYVTKNFNAKNIYEQIKQQYPKDVRTRANILKNTVMVGNLANTIVPTFNIGKMI